MTRVLPLGAFMSTFKKSIGTRVESIGNYGLEYFHLVVVSVSEFECLRWFEVVRRGIGTELEHLRWFEVVRRGIGTELEHLR